MAYDGAFFSVRTGIVMQGIQRKITQAVLYELIAIAILTTGLALFSEESLFSSGLLAAATSAIAMLWNVIFNSLFEAWERRQADRRRSVRRRALHAIGFEGGLAIWCIPVIAFWLGISWWQAFVLDLGLLMFFLFYTYAFNWCFDRIFGLPASASN